MKFFGKKVAVAGHPVPAPVRQRSRPHRSAGLMLGMTAAIFGAIFMGMVVALGSLPLTMLVAGVLVSLPMLAMLSTRQMMPVLFVVVFLIQGTVVYFLQLRAATWFASGLAGMVLLRALVEAIEFRRKSADDKPNSGTGVIVLFAALYLAFYLFSMLIGGASTAQRISSLRFNMPMFGVLLVFFLHRWDDVQIKRLWTIVIVIAMLQLPLTLYQHFFMMSTFSWDGVVGSFGSYLSPVMVLFVLAALLYALASWDRGLMSRSMVSIIVLISTAVILLGEVKAVFIWMPLGVAYVLRRRLLRNMLQLMMFICLSSVFLAGTYTVYNALYWGDHTKNGSVSQNIEGNVEYVFDTSNINYQTGEVSRGASLAIWYHDPVVGPLQRLIGYGPGSTSNSANSGMGKVAARYRGLGVGTTALSTLLWDVGILGTAAYAIFLLAGVRAGWRKSKQELDPHRSVVIDVSTAMLALMITTLVYNRTLLDEPTAQLLGFFCLGCIAQYVRFDGKAPRMQSQRAPAAQDKHFSVQATS